MQNRGCAHAIRLNDKLQDLMPKLSSYLTHSKDKRYCAKCDKNTKMLVSMFLLTFDGSMIATTIQYVREHTQFTNMFRI